MEGHGHNYVVFYHCDAVRFNPFLGSLDKLGKSAKSGRAAPDHVFAILQTRCMLSMNRPAAGPYQYILEDSFMGSTTTVVVSALSLWLASLSADRASTEVLLAGGYSPDELAAAGVTSTQVQAAIALLRTNGDTASYNTAITNHDSACHDLAKWRDDYLRTRSDESAAMLRTAQESRRQASTDLTTATANVRRAVESCISQESLAKINRCLSASHLNLPITCKFVDPAEIDPMELAAAVHKKNRATRRGTTVDPAIDQIIGAAVGGAEVRDAELNLDTLGDSLRFLYDQNLGQ